MTAPVEITQADWELAAQVMGYDNANQVRRHGHMRPQLRRWADKLASHRQSSLPKAGEAGRVEALAKADAVLAKMIAVATAEEGSDLYDEWPIDCMTQVDRWQSILQPALGHHAGFPSRTPLPDGCAMTGKSRAQGQCDRAACNYPFCTATPPQAGEGVAIPAGDRGDFVLMPVRATRKMVDAADACIDAYEAYGKMVEVGRVR